MKSMLWKELRENLKWAALGLLCLLLAEVYTLSSQRHGYSQDYRDLTICSAGFLLVTSFGCAVVGGALAAAQILPELRRDQWAALLHRPVSRGTIFLGKVCGGLLLYFGATLLPFVVSVIQAATPGQFAAPLVPGMVLPGLSDICFGAVCYLATLLLCLHRGRWFGSRGLVALAVAVTFILHVVLPWLWLPILVSATAYALAAWGAMNSNGPVETQPWAGRAAFVLIALLGALTACLLVVLGLSLLPAGPPAPGQDYHSFEITRDGQIFIRTQHPGDDAMVLTDPTGKVITDPQYVGNSAQNFCEMRGLVWNLRPEESTDPRWLFHRPRDSWNYVRDFDSNQGKEIWYLLVGQNYFIGYDKLSRRAVGICDADGFKPAGAVPKPFPFPLQINIYYFRPPMLCWSGAQLYATAFPDRSRVTFTLPDNGIRGASNLGGDYRQEQPHHIAVAMADELRVYDPQGALQFKMPYPHDPNVWRSLEISSNAAGDRFYLQSSAGPYYGSKHPKRTPADQVTLLDEIDARGNLVQSHALPDPDSAPTPTTWLDQCGLLFAPFAPVLAGAILTGDFSPLLAPRSNEGSEAFGASLVAQHSTVGELAILFALALALGVFTRFCAGRLGFSTRRAWGWAGFVFCFGLPGLLTFRLASGWPVRVRCPQCGHKRPVGLEECPRCRAHWPVPRPTGAEIFTLEPFVHSADPAGLI